MSDAPAEAPSPYRRGEEAASADAAPAYEKELQTAEDQFDMNGFYGSDYYVKSGSGTICLSQTGKVNDVKLSFKYGHNQFGPAVSVSYPWGVSFGLDGAETIFQPDEIVYNDFATVK